MGRVTGRWSGWPRDCECAERDSRALCEVIRVGDKRDNACWQTDSYFRYASVDGLHSDKCLRRRVFDQSSCKKKHENLYVSKWLRLT